MCHMEDKETKVKGRENMYVYLSKSGKTGAEHL